MGQTYDRSKRWNHANAGRVGLRPTFTKAFAALIGVPVRLPFLSV